VAVNFNMKLYRVRGMYKNFIFDLLMRQHITNGPI